MTVIATSTAATATAYSNQRKVDRCQNGVLWALFYADGSNSSLRALRLRYSTDDGASWTDAGTVGSGNPNDSENYVGNASIFIDLDDFMHVVYKHPWDGYIYYRRGTPNAGRTAWTWSAAVAVGNYAGLDVPDIVAHREGTGWKAHIVVSGDDTTSIDARYCRINITSAQVVTQETASLFANATRISNTYPHPGLESYPSIDFNHTGDGKTVAGSTPHLYVAWSAGASGAGKGIRFKKATYSGGSWTWGTEQEIDSTRYISGSVQYQCLFDGTRVNIAGEAYTGSIIDVIAHERNAEDTTTITRVLEANASGSLRITYTSTTFDGYGNIYFVGKAQGALADLQYRKWTRSSEVFESPVPVANVSGATWVSAKRGYSNNLIEFIYTDGTASPYNVTYGSISLFTAATVNVWTGAAFEAKPLKRYDGAGWAEVEDSAFKRYDGAGWVLA